MFKKIKFKESGYPIIEVSFWLIVLLSIVSIIIILFSDIYNFSVKSLNYPLEKIKINMEYDKKISPSNVLFCFEDYCSSLESDLFNNVYQVEFSNESDGFLKTKVKNIYLAYPKNINNLEDYIRNVDIHIGYKNYYYTKDDIKKIDKKTTTITINKEEKQYSVIPFPKVNNYKGVLSHIKILFLSLFYNWQLFFIPYFWLFCACLIYIFNKDKFKYKPNFELNKKTTYIILSVILLIAAFLRIVDITYFPLWNDEIYTKTTALENFKSCFQDAGNPPLFFIIDFIFTKIFSNSNLALRFPSLIFGILFVFMTFKLFKNFGYKEALFIAFFASINLINIYHSQEARGYALSMLLIVSSIYVLLKYLKNPTNKNLIYYGIMTLLCINNNYYLILFSFTNFIWGIVDLAENKNKKEILKFTLINFIACLTFIPYLIISSKNAISTGFNGWIPEISKENFLYIINAYFINKYIFLILCALVLIALVLCLLPQKIKKKLNIETNLKKENLFIYLIYSLALILILASLISVFIKPIVHKRVLLSIYSLLFLLETLMITGVFEFKKINKLLASAKLLYSCILLFICFSITIPMSLRELINTNDFMQFVLNDSKLYSSDYEIHAITTDAEQQLGTYNEILNNKRIKWHFFSANSGYVIHRFKKADYIPIDKKGVLYFNTVGVDMENIVKFNPSAYVYNSNLTTSAKIIWQ